MDKIQNIDYHIVDKCNLNCKHCNHFCPLVPKDTPVKPLGKIIRDLSYLYDYQHIFGSLTVIGGEPFLHPDISKVFDFVRTMFPDKYIQSITNGTLYQRLPEVVDSIIRNNIHIGLSLYPLPNSKDIRTAFEKCIPSNLLSIDDMSSTIGFSNMLLQEKLNSDYEKIFECPRRFCCTQLRNNRLYICHYAASLYLLKEHFGDDVKIDESDCSIELGPQTTPEMVLRFINNYMPDICRHCADVLQYSIQDNIYYYNCVPWRTSNMELSEFYAR